MTDTVTATVTSTNPITGTTTTVTPAPTKGYQTSEFWVTAIVTLAGILNQSGLLGTAVIPTDTLAIIAGAVATYVLSRTVVKATS